MLWLIWTDQKSVKYANTAASHSPSYATTKGPCESIRRQAADCKRKFSKKHTIFVKFWERSVHSWELQLNLVPSLSFSLLSFLKYWINICRSLFTFLAAAFSFSLVFFLTHLSPPNKQGWACPCRKTKVSREERFGTDNKVFVIYILPTFFSRPLKWF